MRTIWYYGYYANGELFHVQDCAGKRNRNEMNSIYYENIVREEKGFPERGYNYSAGD